MFIVVGKQGEIMRHERLTPCMQWLTAKAAEYSQCAWIPRSDGTILALDAGMSQWELQDTRNIYKWTVTVDGHCIGIFDNKDDAERSVEMTWGKAVFTYIGELPADTVRFACGQASGTLRRILVSHSAGKLTGD